MSALTQTHPYRLESSEKHAEAFKLRLAGHDYAYISEKLGYAGGGSVHYAITSELEKRIGPYREEYRQLILAREEAMWLKAYAKFEASEEINLDLIDKLLRILDRMAKHAGLAAPKVQINVGAEDDGDAEPVDVSTPAPKSSPADQIQSLLDKLRSRAAEQAKPLDVIDHEPGVQNRTPETNGHNGSESCNPDQ